MKEGSFPPQALPYPRELPHRHPPIGGVDFFGFFSLRVPVGKFFRVGCGVNLFDCAARTILVGELPDIAGNAHEVECS